MAEDGRTDRRLTVRGSALVVSMPWCAASRPNLSAGVVCGIFRNAGWRANVFDACLIFATRIGCEAYELLAETPSLFGALEHIFASQLFGAEALDSDAFLERMSGADGASALKTIRDDIIPAYLDEMAERLLREAPEIVGFSCTFNQVFASLSLAARLRARGGKMRLLFGGACMHGEMGETYAAAFPDLIDHVFLGEAERPLVELLAALEQGGAVPSIAGIASGGDSGGFGMPTADLSCVPAPAYEDYFALREALGAAGHALPPVSGLPFESSRGCWWGAKSHCTFCGLNNLGMAYREKPVDTVFDEVMDLARRFRTNRLLAADNIITRKSFGPLVQAFADSGLDLHLFYETKANLSRDDIAALAGAGIRWIQPGIESFSDHVLKLMRKGTSTLQNVQLIRLCAEFAVTPSYNILIGFPGETDADYEAMLDLLPRLRHLPAPSGRPGLVQVHRFSPFHGDPEGHGFRNVRPAEYYRHLAPAGRLDLAKTAYFFDYDRDENAPSARHEQGLTEAVEAWMQSGERATLQLGAGFIAVAHSSGAEPVRTQPLDPVESAILVLADRIQGVEAAVQMVSAAMGESETRVRAAIDRLCVQATLLRIDDRLLSLIPYQAPKSSAELRSWASRYLSPALFRGEQGSGGAAPSLSLAVAG